MRLPNLLPAAQQELREAADWYEARRPGLGLDLLRAVDQALRAVAEGPERFPSWAHNERYRCLVLDRFPYLVFFHAPDGAPEVVAFAHARRRPGYWLARTAPGAR